VVSIPSSVVVSYDQVSDVRIDTVAVQAGGSLRFRTDTSTRLRVNTILVMPSGELTIGTVTSPVAEGVRAEVIINNAPIDTARDPGQYGNGLIGYGKVTMHGAANSANWLALAAEARAGDATIQLAAPVTGWDVGDRLVLPDSRQLYWGVRPDNGPGAFVDQTEVRTVAGISPDGRTITLSAPLAYSHLGARDPDGRLDILPKIANLSRNVVVRSEANVGTRGHTIFMHRAEVDIRHAQFGALGRTQISVLDDTTYDAAGNVTRVGTNQNDRVPVNFHHLIGPATTPANGYQFTFEGNSVFCSTPMPFRWGITLKDSHFGLIRNNTLDNWAGAGIVAGQTGNEIGNLIDGNFVNRITDVGGGGQPYGRGYGEDTAHEGVGIWSRSNAVQFRNNTVANSHKGYSTWAEGLHAVRVPLFPGADIRQEGQYRVVNMTNTSFVEFSGNETYGGMTQVGISIYNLNHNGGGGEANPNAQESVIRDMKIWHTFDMAYYNYKTNRLTFDGLVARGDTSLMRDGRGGAIGFYSSDYLEENMTIRNSNIQGYGVGVDTALGPNLQIRDTYMRNWRDIHLNPQWTAGGDARGLLDARSVTITNVRFDPIDVVGRSEWGPKTFLFLDGSIRAGSSNLIMSDVVKIYDYNGNRGENYRAYYREQAADAILPKTDVREDGFVRRIGSPVDGLTNAQNWAQYGIAFAGAVAPSNTVTRDGVIGLLARI
jgi:hypothetical protein